MLHFATEKRTGFICVITDCDDIVPLVIQIFIHSFGVFLLISIPTSAITLTALGLTAGAGDVPAECTSSLVVE